METVRLAGQVVVVVVPIINIAAVRVGFVVALAVTIVAT